MSYKIFIQIYLALNLNQDPKVTPHLCSALRENPSFSEYLKQCTDNRDELCDLVYIRRCEIE